jgi:hypothetical protein
MATCRLSRTAYLSPHTDPFQRLQPPFYWLAFSGDSLASIIKKAPKKTLKLFGAFHACKFLTSTVGFPRKDFEKNPPILPPEELAGVIGRKLI